MSRTASAASQAIVFLNPGDPPESFPDLTRGTTGPDGLIAVGGDLTPSRLLAAYGRGIFPWYEEGQPVLWWSPDPRAVLLPEKLHISRTLRRTLLGNRFQVSMDLAFGSVMAACADTRAATGTWITPEMRRAYLDLHSLGYAHSIEIWRGSDLAGGLYGIALGDVFFGESMFSRAADASKVALVKLARVADDQGITLIDCQVATRHLTTLGSHLMPRDEFLRQIQTLSVAAGRVGAWRAEARPTRSLIRTPKAPAPLHG